MRCAVVLMLAGCGPRTDHEPTAAPTPRPVATARDATTLEATIVDAVAERSPPTLPEALTALDTVGFGGAADSLRRRVDQHKPKLKLEPTEALETALALLALADNKPVAALEDVMPRSTVELVRATRHRGLSIDEAERIAVYLVHVTATLGFERLESFDENHSHVTGREWRDIDYSGEAMTWQSQRAYWEPRNVPSFKTREAIHAYFIGAEKLPHWRKVYRPRGKMADVRLP